MKSLITKVAPSMPQDIRRWLLEPNYAAPSVAHQDWDLSLAEWDYLPLLIEYAEDAGNPLEKRYEALSALFMLQQSAANASEPDQAKLRQHIQHIILHDPNFARSAAEWLGAVESLIIKTMLKDELPPDLPEWIRTEIKRRA
jgi:hypothetical protein